MSAQDRPGRRQALIVEFEANPAYEFLMTLCAFSDAANYASFDIGKEWFDDVRKKASSDLMATVEQFSFHSYEVWEHMLGLVYDCPTPRDVPTFIALIEAIDRWNSFAHAGILRAAASQSHATRSHLASGARRYRSAKEDAENIVP